MTTTTAAKIAAVLTEHPDSTQAQIAAAAGIGRSTVTEGLARMVARDEVTRANGEGPATYRLVPPAPAESCHCGSDEVGHVHTTRKGGKRASRSTRAPLPEGYVTPVGLTKELNARGLYHGARKDGLSSQMVYSYMKANGPDSAHPFPVETVDGRQLVKLDAGVQWWTDKEARVAQRGKDTAAAE